MSTSFGAPGRAPVSSPTATLPAPPHLLVVEADADANALLRLLEPFVIHDVLPHRIDAARCGDALAVELEFSCEEAVAERLEARLAAMVVVRDVALRLGRAALAEAA